MSDLPTTDSVLAALGFTTRSGPGNTVVIRNESGAPTVTEDWHRARRALDRASKDLLRQSRQLIGSGREVHQQHYELTQAALALQSARGRLSRG
ncbi:hypothetical protein [Actinosynnema pretiosum]|uniref:Uncharacterized protein n=1 Tax=Actinosynnema pretiosum TaxID=42197 RepID=A0A290Z3Q2_9PSEU|nr:hypothetical protein [Actinosynnema pretiosum]ATE53614.1 hypothetical protein CNX65_10185 [Actinosynnema pretiosum]